MVDQEPLEEVITLVLPTVPIRNNERPTTNLVEEPRTKGHTREFLELGINRRRTQPPAGTTVASVDHPRHDIGKRRLRARRAPTQGPPLSTLEAVKRVIDGRRKITERCAFRRTKEESCRHVHNQMAFNGLRFHRPREQDHIVTYLNALDNKDRPVIRVAETDQSVLGTLIAVPHFFGHRLDKTETRVVCEESTKTALVVHSAQTPSKRNRTHGTNSVEKAASERSLSCLPQVSVISVRKQQ